MYPPPSGQLGAAQHRQREPCESRHPGCGGGRGVHSCRAPRADRRRRQRRRETDVETRAAGRAFHHDRQGADNALRTLKAAPDLLHGRPTSATPAPSEHPVQEESRSSWSRSVVCGRPLASGPRVGWWSPAGRRRRLWGRSSSRPGSLRCEISRGGSLLRQGARWVPRFPRPGEAFARTASARSVGGATTPTLHMPAHLGEGAPVLTPRVGTACRVPGGCPCPSPRLLLGAQLAIRCAPAPWAGSARLARRCVHSGVRPRSWCSKRGTGGWLRR
jgi:hypothetical protein